jgi:putative membrane protein
MTTTKNYSKSIMALSIIVPIVIASLFRIKLAIELPVFLPPIYASINALTAILLVTAIWAIKNNKRKLHERLIKTSMGLTLVFLVMYILYHATSNDTHFGGEGFIKYLYFFILISHIILSVTVIPFVLFTFVKALNNEFNKHRKLGKVAFSLWLYVAVTGVIVYLMISPYYAN